jgi:hypothetical protein
MDPRSVVSVLRASVVVLVTLLVPASAMADRHKAGFGGSGVYSGGSSLYGIGITGDWTVKEGPLSPAKHDAGVPDPFEHFAWTLSVAGEATQVAGTHEGSNFSRTALLAGGRFTLNQMWGLWRIEPFAEVLVGPVYERNLESRTHLGGSFGAGLDVPFGTLTSTEHHPLVVARLQYGRHWVNGDTTSWYNQVSLGVVFRLTRKK